MVFEGTGGPEDTPSVADTGVQLDTTLLTIPLSPLTLSFGVSHRGSGGGCSFLRQVILKNDAKMVLNMKNSNHLLKTIF